MLVWKTYSNNIFYSFIDIIWLIFYTSQEKIHLYFQMVFGWLTSLVFQVPTSLIRYVKGKSETKHTWFSAVMSLYGNQKWLFSCRENWTNRICRVLLGHDKYARFFFSEPFIEIHNEHTLLSTNPIVWIWFVLQHVIKFLEFIF